MRKNISWIFLVMWLCCLRADRSAPEHLRASLRNSGLHGYGSGSGGGRRTDSSSRATRPARTTTTLGTPPTPSRVERYYEPYWEGGHWVFERYTTQETPSTLPNETTVTTTPRAHPNPFKMKKLQHSTLVTHMYCNPMCPMIFTDFGVVCGRKLATEPREEDFKYVYRTFRSICHLEVENCIDHKRREMWQVLHRGSCDAYLTPMEGYEQPTDGDALLQRAASWHDLLHPPTTTRRARG